MVLMSGIMCVNGKTKHRNAATKARCPLCRSKNGKGGRGVELPDTASVGPKNELDSLREAVQYETPRDIDDRYVDSMYKSAEYAGLLRALNRTRDKKIAGHTENDLLSLMEGEERKRQVLNEEYDDRGGWNRYYLVTGGHLHNNKHCSGLKQNTQLHLTPQVSGLSDEEVVEYAGERMCTSCNPDAPVDALRKKSVLLTPEEKEDAERREKEKAASEARAKEKARKKAANTLPAPVYMPEAYGDKAYPIDSKSKATQAVNYIFEKTRIYGDDLNDDYLPGVVDFLRMTNPDSSDEEILAKTKKKQDAAKRKSIKQSQHYYNQGMGSAEETDAEQSKRIDQAMSWLERGFSSRERV